MIVFKLNLTLSMLVTIFFSLSIFYAMIFLFIKGDYIDDGFQSKKIQFSFFSTISYYKFLLKFMKSYLFFSYVGINPLLFTLDTIFEENLTIYRPVAVERFMHFSLCQLCFHFISILFRL